MISTVLLEKEEMQLKRICALIGAIFVVAGIIIVAKGETDARRLDRIAAVDIEQTDVPQEQARSCIETFSRISGNSRRVGRAGGLALIVMGIPWFFFKSKKNETGEQNK